MEALPSSVTSPIGGGGVGASPLPKGDLPGSHSRWSVTAAPTTMTHAAKAPQRSSGQLSQGELIGLVEGGTSICGIDRERIFRQSAQFPRCCNIRVRSGSLNVFSANAVSRLGSGCIPVFAVACRRCRTTLGTCSIFYSFTRCRTLTHCSRSGLGSCADMSDVRH